MPVRIPASVIAYWNPEANNEKATEFASALERTMARRMRKGTLFVDGEYVFRPTLEDEGKRIRDMVEQARRFLGNDFYQSINFPVIGGDRTGADGIEGVAESRRELAQNGMKPNIAAVPIGKGTANDISNNAGVPKTVDGLIKFLGRSKVVGVPLLQFELIKPNGDVELRKSPYGFTGPNSGKLFREVEQLKKKRRAQGKGVTVSDYLKRLFGTVWSARKPIYVKVKKNGQHLNGGKPFTCGEVIGPLVTPQIGNVTILPIPAMGARIYLAYKFPWGVPPFLEPFGRKILVDLGFQHLINAGDRVYPLSKDRQIDLMPGDEIEMEFLRADGGARGILGTVSGDSIGPITGLKAKIVDTVPVRCDPHCNWLVQQRLAAPRLPLDGLTHGAVSSAVNYLGGYVSRTFA